MVEIKLKALEKQFIDEDVICGIDLTIKPGELVALLGPSGCGKTTTLKIIAGLIDADKGDILFGDKSVLKIPTEEREAVLVFQDYLLFPHLTVGKNIAFGLKMRGVAKKRQLAKTEELLELVNLAGYQDCYPHELSGGQQQRISLARALAIDPKVLLLDEPLSNLDANLREEMQQFITRIHREQEMTTIFVTHDREEAMLMADRIAVMNQGQIEQFGQAEELYKRPKNKFVADFFGKANYLPGEVVADKFEFVYGQLELNAKESKSYNTALIRPEFIEFKPGKDKGYLKFEVEVVKKRFVGERIHYQLSAQEEELIATSLSQASLEVGEKLEVGIHADNIWLMEF